MTKHEWEQQALAHLKILVRKTGGDFTMAQARAAIEKSPFYTVPADDRWWGTVVLHAKAAGIMSRVRAYADRGGTKLTTVWRAA